MLDLSGISVGLLGGIPLQLQRCTNTANPMCHIKQTFGVTDLIPCNRSTALENSNFPARYLELSHHQYPPTCLQSDSGVHKPWLLVRLISTLH